MSSTDKMIYLLLTTKLFGSAIASAIQSGVLHYKVTPDTVRVYVQCVCVCFISDVLYWQQLAQSDYSYAHIVNICYICCPIAAFLNTIETRKNIFGHNKYRWLIFLLQLAFFAAVHHIYKIVKFHN